MTTTHDWLRQLYGHDLLDDHLLSICWRGPRGMSFRHLPMTELDGAASLLDNLSTTTCTWVGCCPLDRRPDSGRGGSEHVGAVVGLWADVDVAGPRHRHGATTLPLPPDRDAAWQLLAAVGLPPTAVVDSGGGLQAWWLLHDPWLLWDADDRAAATSLSRQWASTLVEHGRRAGWHVDSVGDLARILRPAGSWNRKPNVDPAPVVPVLLDGPRYDTLDLGDVLLPVEPAPAASLPSPTPVDPFLHRHSVSVADTFAQHVTWAELLESRGWRRYIAPNGQPGTTSPCPSCGQRGELWSHPGVELDHLGRPDHPSATCCHVIYSYSESTATTGLPTAQPFTKFRAFARWDFGGDMKAAARAILRAASDRTTGGKR